MVMEEISSARPAPHGKITIPRLTRLKQLGEPISALTAYDYPGAALVDAAGVDLVLVGDSMSSVVLGHENTLPVTVEEMLTAVMAVRRGLRRALLVADLPFGSFHGDASRTIETSVRFIKAGAEAVKLEGGAKRCALVAQLVDADIAVMAHIGLTPQSIHRMGGYRVQGRTVEDARRLVDDAKALEEAGAFALVLECIPSEVAAHITREIGVPTIGIGSGRGCDGQILVYHDLLGLTVPPPPAGLRIDGPESKQGKKPRFVREYLDLRSLIEEAVKSYVDDIKSGSFPDASETYGLSEADAATAPKRKTSAPAS